MDRSNSLATEQEGISEMLAETEREACLATLNGRWETVPLPANGAGGQEQLYTYARPEYAVAQAMADGRPSYEALREWQQAMREMLAHYRPRRRNATLLEASSALQYLGDPHPLLTPPRADGGDEVATTRQLYLALASLQVKKTPDTERVTRELGASTQPLPGWNESPEVDTDAIVIEWHRMQAQLQETREAVAAAESRLQTSEVAHQRVSADLEVAERDKGALNERLTEAMEARDKLQHESKDRQEENELLLLQLHQVQEELEQYYLENLDLRQYREQVKKVREEKRKERAKHEDRLTKEKAARERDAKKHRVQILKRDVREFETSNAWRLMAPLRFASRLITLRWRRRPALDLSGSPDNQVQVLEQHLDELHRAGTWRITAPIRALGRLVRRS